MSVACVPARSAARGPDAELPQVRTVLVTTDFSELADRAIAYACALAPPGGTVHLLHVTPPPVLSTTDERDAETRDLCVRAARRAGLALDDLMLAQLLEGAPYALQMARRLRRDHDLHHEPSTVFSIPSTLGS
jgi:nucleotide-binding universal stress UspA family protein